MSELVPTGAHCSHQQPALGQNQNVELKARVADVDRARRIAEQVSTSFLGREHQIDTYFGCREGRLKLRQIDGATAHLIWYRRPDQIDEKVSDYCIIAVQQPEELRRALDAAAGITNVVDKTREIFLYENVRIHLDDVQRLGTFLEFEAVLGPDDNQQSGEAKVKFLRQKFEIAACDLLANSYCDLFDA